MAVLISSHDFGGEEVLGGIRWVNESRSEWNFGGGFHKRPGLERDRPAGRARRRPSAGTPPGRGAGLRSERAIERLTAGETPCALEMSQEFDTGPPVIKIVRNDGEVVSRTPLIGEAVTFA